MPSFEDLPFELVSEILSIAAELNLNEPGTISYSYGLTQAPRLMQNKTSVQKYVRGRLPTDVLLWNSVNAIRQVNRRWHHWALSHSLKELYIRRWQGGETWMRQAFESVATVDHVPVVYQDPYNSVQRTAELLNDYPSLAQHVRKIWFNGIYRFDTVRHIFNILRNCLNLRTVTLPWTALRYADKENWDNLLSFPRLRSLEFLAVELKEQVCALSGSQTDTKVLQNGLDFSNIRRLKIFGDSNFKPVTDDDLILMAQTATNLEEILITNVSSITAKGVAVLVLASRNSLRLLEFIPLVNSGFAPPQMSEGPCNVHFCDIIVSCPRLIDIAVTLPTVCTHFFSNPRVDWRETVRVRVAGIGAISGQQDSPVDNLRELLDAARGFLQKKRQSGQQLSVEIAIGCFLFDVEEQRVHGNYEVAKLTSEMQWTPVEKASVKGPYGYTGLYGVGMKGEWSCITEDEFLEAVRYGLIMLN